MIKVILIGSGNVAHHLIIALKKAQNISLVQVLARNKEKLLDILDEEVICTDWSALKHADLYIIAVSDNAIGQVAYQIPFTNQLVVHTSGSVAMDELYDKNRKGVFYPLQSFSKNKSVAFSEVPICLESQTKEDYLLLEKVAQSISNTVYSINSTQRKSLHVSAVFVNNFVNHLYQIAYSICKEHKVPFDVLKPLIIETAQKIMTLTPSEAQTGPAKRNDTQTINTHLSLLSDSYQKEIYKIITKSIIDNGKKL